MRTSSLLCLLGCPGLLGLLEPLLALVDLCLGVVVVELGLERLAVDDAVQDSEGEGRVPRDLTGHRRGVGREGVRGQLELDRVNELALTRGGWVMCRMECV